MSTYEISKSSLLSLKAEILRKQQELSKNKAENDVKIQNLRKKAPLDFKNKGLEQRQKNDLTEEEENLLLKSKSALEAKSKLYDKLSKGSKNLTEDEKDFNKRYLVRFDKKNRNKSRVPDLPPEDSEDDYDRHPESDDEIGPHYEPPRNPDEEWVEYVDCLGRTRTCLRKDLEYLKSKDKDLKSTVDAKRRNRSPTPPPPPSPPSPELDNDNESELTEDNELMSTDMRREMLRRQWEKEEDELRDKSDIHYQDILFNEARTHGVGYYGFSKDEEERAKQQEALKKLRQDTQQQQKKSQEMKMMRERQLAARVKAAKNRKRARMGLPPEEDVPEPAPEPPPKPVEINKEVEKKEKLLSELRKKHVRPWDKHKEGVRKEHYEYSQEEWVDKKRKERPDEFAPPSFRREYHSTARREIDESHKSLRFSSKKAKEAKELRNVNPYKMAPTPIPNEVEVSSDESEVGDGRGLRAEVAPPCTYDYYGPNDKKRARAAPSGNMGDSIEAGLKFLREQIEKKQGGSRRSEDLFLS